MLTLEIAMGKTPIPTQCGTFRDATRVCHAQIALRPQFDYCPRGVDKSPDMDKLLHHSGRALDVVLFGDIEDRNRTIA